MKWGEIGLPRLMNSTGYKIGIMLEITNETWPRPPRYYIFDENLPALVKVFEAHYTEIALNQTGAWTDYNLYTNSETGGIKIPVNMPVADAVDHFGKKMIMKTTAAPTKGGPAMRAAKAPDATFFSGGAGTASTNFASGTTTPRKLTKQEFAEKIRPLRSGGENKEENATASRPSSSTPSYRARFGMTADPNRLLRVEEIEIEKKEFEQRLREGRVFCTSACDG